MSSNIDGVELRERRARGYEGPRPDVQELVPRSAKQILELGCSTGALGAAVKQRNGAFVFGVEIDADFVSEAQKRLDKVVAADAEQFLRGPKPEEAPFDCLIGADVFEHLVDPWTTLDLAIALLGPGATVVVSLPNVLYWQDLLVVLIGGRWPRRDEGIFDRTHLRWFTRLDAIDLLQGAGLSRVTASGKYRQRGWRLAIVKALARTPLKRFMASQWLLVGMKP